MRSFMATALRHDSRFKADRSGDLPALMQIKCVPLAAAA